MSQPILGQRAGFLPGKRLALLLGCLLFSTVASRAADLVVPDNVYFERNTEFANPDNQHLLLNLARPAKGNGPFPAGLKKAPAITLVVGSSTGMGMTFVYPPPIGGAV